MATTIVTKKGSGAPAASDLVEGELAVDTTNGRLYTENSSAAVVELGSNPSGNITFGDNGKAIFGADGDLEIFYNGTHSVFKDGSAGNIYIQDDNNIVLGSIGGENYLVATKDDAVTLYHDAVAKIATTATGVDVSGTVTADGLTVNSGAGDLTASFQSTDQFADLKLTDSGGSSYIRQSNGSLLLQADRDNASSNSIVQVSVDGVQTARFSSGGDISFYEDTGTTAKLFWDASAESLGIGTSSINSNAALEVHGGQLRVAASSQSSMFAVANSTTYSDGVTLFSSYNGSGSYGPMIFDVNGEAMRIDASGNLLVGTTDTTIFNDNADEYGFMVEPSGQMQLSANNATMLYLNRQNGDGEIVSFRKDGAAVGSIGTRSSGLVVGSGDTGLFYDGGGDRIFPESPSGGAARDAAIDLGTSAARFKDLYLSGGAYLGGTAAANKLDDYEEGTWTPTITGSTTAGAFTYAVQQGKYTKVGNSVALHCAIAVSATSTSPVGDMTITGLPFAVSSQFPSFAVGWSQFITFADQLGAYGGGSIITLRNMLSGGSGGLVQGSAFGSTFYLFISGSYHV